MINRNHVPLYSRQHRADDVSSLHFILSSLPPPVPLHALPSPSPSHSFRQDAIETARLSLALAAAHRAAGNPAATATALRDVLLALQVLFRLLTFLSGSALISRVELG
jgi:hypothetical protein